MKSYDYRSARIKVRRGPDWHVRPEMEQFDGQEVLVRYGWDITEGDRKCYAGEVAWMLERDSPVSDAAAWIASGDLEFLDEAERGKG